MPRQTRISDGYDYKSDGRAIDVKLLRALAMGGKRSVEIQLLLDSHADQASGYQQLALVLTDISTQEEVAKATFEKLREHQKRLSAALSRQIGIKAAALDYLENVERELGVKEDEQEMTYAQLAQLAFRDDLTGLANFRYFTRRIGEETKRAERYSHLLSLIMLDIDHFKKFNDTYGHLSGNRALEHVAKILNTEVRETDLVARYGGEEFAIVLPETTKREAGELAERIRARIEQTAVALPDHGKKKLTVSLGVATYPRDADSPETLQKNADEALYSSKKEGRNRISFFTPQSAARLKFMPEQARSARTVHVIGDFNGWDKGADPLQRDDKGVFNLELRLAPGRYAYKFLINGEWFLADPLCNEFTLDGYGGRNSVLVVK
ncbi:MAG TPA: diguanylate cyclase [Planctomycetota bacterium]|nr:diguanylate cyclase [Planctomycetota bacterium]